MRYGYELKAKSDPFVAQTLDYGLEIYYDLYKNGTYLGSFHLLGWHC